MTCIETSPDSKPAIFIKENKLLFAAGSPIGACKKKLQWVCLSKPAPRKKDTAEEKVARCHPNQDRVAVGRPRGERARSGKPTKQGGREAAIILPLSSILRLPPLAYLSKALAWVSPNLDVSSCPSSLQLYCRDTFSLLFRCRFWSCLPPPEKWE